MYFLLYAYSKNNGKVKQTLTKRHVFVIRHAFVRMNDRLLHITYQNNIEIGQKSAKYNNNANEMLKLSLCTNI